MDTDQRKLLRGPRGLDIIGALHGRSLKLKGGIFTIRACYSCAKISISRSSVWKYQSPESFHTPWVYLYLMKLSYANYIIRHTHRDHQRWDSYRLSWTTLIMNSSIHALRRTPNAADSHPLRLYVCLADIWSAIPRSEGVIGLTTDACGFWVCQASYQHYNRRGWHTYYCSR